MSDSAYAELRERLRTLITEGDTLAQSFDCRLGKDRFWGFIRSAIETLWLLEDRLYSVSKEFQSLPWTTILAEEDELGSSENAYREEYQMTLTDFDYATFKRAVELLKIVEFKVRMESESHSSVGMVPHRIEVSAADRAVNGTRELLQREPMLHELVATGSPLKEEIAARMLGVEVSTLQRWRLLEKGPAFHKIGRAVRYLPQDIRDYLAGQRISDRTHRD